MNPRSFLQMISFVFELASMHSGGYTAPTGFLRWFANSVYDVSCQTCMEGFWEEEALFMHREVVKYDTCYGWWVCVTMLHMLFGKGGTHAMSLKLDTIWTYTASPVTTLQEGLLAGLTVTLQASTRTSKPRRLAGSRGSWELMRRLDMAGRGMRNEERGSWWNLVE